MDRMPLRPFCFSVLLAAAALCRTGPLRAQPARPAMAQANQNKDPKQQQQPQPEKGYSSSATAQAEADSPGENPNAAPDAHKFDRFRAEQDIEVAAFYLHKGDPDAAIPRLEEAARLRPDYGKPRFLLAECYEKKHDPDNAVKYLKQYLKVYPHAPDAKKVREKINRLEKEEQ
jgi:tetratricopeptide (TPR) repeat protein